MIKTICDRCHKELDTENEYAIFLKVNNYDLCPGCFHEYIEILDKFIKDGKK